MILSDYFKINQKKLKLLQIKIHITLINNILLDADVAEGDGRIGMVENLLQEFNVVKLFIMVVAKRFP